MQSKGLSRIFSNHSSKAGVDSVSLLQEIFPTKELNWCLLHCKHPARTPAVLTPRPCLTSSSSVCTSSRYFQDGWPSSSTSCTHSVALRLTRTHRYRSSCWLTRARCCRNRETTEARERGLWALTPAPRSNILPDLTCTGGRPRQPPGVGGKLGPEPRVGLPEGPGKPPGASQAGRPGCPGRQGAPHSRGGDSHQPGDVGCSEHPLIRHTDPVVDGEIVFLGRYNNKG